MDGGVKFVYRKLEKELSDIKKLLAKPRNTDSIECLKACEHEVNYFLYLLRRECPEVKEG